MRKNSYIFTAILAIVVSTGAWADAPDSVPDGVVTDPITGAHNVYRPENLADSGIAGVKYVNRVGEMAGAAAQAAEAHAAHASKSASAAQSSADSADAKAADAAAAAAAAQASADDAADAANSITNGDGITIEISDDKKKEITVKPKDNGGISVDEDGVAVVPNTTKGISVDSSGVAVIPNTNKGISVDSSGVAVIPNTNKGISVDKDGVAVIPNTDKGISVDKDGVAVKAGTGIVVDANGVAVKAGTGISVDEDGVAVAGAGVTTLGGMYAPATNEEYMQILTEIQNNGGDIYNPADYRTVALTAPLAGELAAQGGLSGAYRMIDDVPAMIPSNYDELKSRPVSAYALWQGTLSENVKQREISEYSYVNISDATNTSNHAVGDVARPVYVMDKETDGVHTGEVAPIQSVAIPVDADNFEDATTTAKIWIQK